MRLLDITADIGPGASPATLETLIRGIRVAVDVARDADVRRIRRSVAEQMKFPTDSELRAATEQFPPGDEQSPRYRAERQLDARKRLRQDVLHGPPEFWFEWFYRRGQGLERLDPVLREAGFERFLSTSPLPGGAVGLDVIDPTLYQALVSDAVGRRMPTAVGVRQLRYENPFFNRLFGKGTGEQTISTTADVIETVSTLGSTRKMAKAAAEVAERTVGHRVDDSELDVELKRLKVEQERQALIAAQLANVRTAEELAAARRQRVLIEAALRRGRLDIADALGDLDPLDALALGDLGLHHTNLDLRDGPDEVPDDA